jgi:hypothetical protein
VRDIFCANHALLSNLCHIPAAEADEARLRQTRAQIGNDRSAVVVARGLASREKDARI